MNGHPITLMILLPFLGALLQSFIKPSRWVALAGSVGSSLLTLVTVASMRSETADLQFVENLPWVGSYAITYAVGLDGLSAPLVLLIATVFPLLIAAEWHQKLGVRGMHGLFLILQSSLLGAVCAQDLFLMFFFWALSAIPFYFLIGIWGGPRRESAAFRSVVVSALSNALLFAALVVIYYSVDPHSFSIQELAGGKLAGKAFQFLGWDIPVSEVVFALVAAGLMLRAPVWPLHGWFTEAAEEASASVFVALSAVAVPVATALFIRIVYTLLPDTLVQAAPYLVAMGGLNLIAGGLCAMAQRGLRLLIAYLCICEVGLILLGAGSLSAPGIVGAVYQQLTLGLSLAGFGLFTGVVIERTGKSKFIDDSGNTGLGGIALEAPVMALFAGIMVASILGVPGLGGFVGHALLVIGSYSVHPAAMGLTGLALILVTYSLFTMYRYVFLGRPTGDTKGFTDLSVRERAYLLPLIGGLLLFGMYPKPLLELIRPTVLTLLSTVK